LGDTETHPAVIFILVKRGVPMDNPELCELLEQLQREIEETETVDEKELELLRDLGVDIRELLERCQAEQVQAQPLIIRRWDDAIESLAVNHPTLTAMISNISRILSNAGI
jgi:hypothetical protein